MKAVLISIQPKWCELIANGEKTLEVRKTRPKLETPFKCYIYMTAGNASYPVTKNGAPYMCHNNGGKVVIGEFVCDRIFPIRVFNNGTIQDWNFNNLADSCVPYDDVVMYIGNNRNGYGWHISNLVIYDEPKPLSEFVVEGDCDCLNCKNCSWFDNGNGFDVEDDCNLAYENIHRKGSLKPLFRPPQSWCYVEVCDD